MNKKLFRLALVCALLGAGAAMTSCTDYDQDIADLQKKVTALEALQNKVETLQAKIDAGAVITSVKNENGKVTVVLSDGKTFVLTDGANGADGKPGADGKNGTVWTISEDGYWMKDGVKTEYKAVAKDGEPGLDGCYYVPNVQTGYFDQVLSDGTVVPTEIAIYVPGTLVAVLGEDGVLTLKDGYTGEDVYTIAAGLVSLDNLQQSSYWLDYPLYYEESAVSMYYLGDSDSLAAVSKGTAYFTVTPTNANLKNASFKFVHSYTRDSEESESAFVILEDQITFNKGILAVPFVIDTTIATLPDIYELLGIPGVKGAGIENFHVSTQLCVTLNNIEKNSDRFYVRVDAKDLYDVEIESNFESTTFYIGEEKTIAPGDSVSTYAYVHDNNKYEKLDDRGLLQPTSLDSALTYKAVLKSHDDSVVVDAAKLENGIIALNDSIDGTYVEYPFWVYVQSYIGEVMVAEKPILFTIDTPALDDVYYTADAITINFDALPSYNGGNAFEGKYGAKELLAKAGIDTTGLNTSLWYASGEGLIEGGDLQGTNGYADFDEDSLYVEVTNYFHVPFAGDTLEVTYTAWDNRSYPNVIVKFPIVITHNENHTWPAFNPNHLDEDGETVLANGEILSSGIGGLNKNLVMRAKISDMFDAASQDTLEFFDIEVAEECAEFAQIVPGSFEAGETDGYLALVDTVLSQNQPIEVKMIMRSNTRGYRDTCTFEYTVKFESPLTISYDEPINLQAVPNQSSSINLNNALTIKYFGTSILTNLNLYGVKYNVTYELDGENIDPSVSLNGSSLKWDDKGNTLVSDVVVPVKATVVINNGMIVEQFDLNVNVLKY